MTNVDKSQENKFRLIVHTLNFPSVGSQTDLVIYLNEADLGGVPSYSE